MLLIMCDERGILLQGNAPDLQIQIADDLARLLELRLEVPKAPGGQLVVG